MSELSAEKLGLAHVGKVFHNLSYAQLFEHEVANNEGHVLSSNTMTVDTGKFTGRSPKDKFFVQQTPSSDHIAWGNVNKSVSAEIFDELYADVIEYLSGKNIYVTAGYSGAHADTRKSVRFITEFAWQSHFVKNMFIRPTESDLTHFSPDFRVYNASHFTNEKWEKQGLNSEVFCIFNIEKNVAIIGGTWYGGEMKKGIFTMMNYWLPLEKILSMHCSANVGKEGDVALFFGLSGTGKTTLSTDSERKLIGDDEH